MRNNKSFFIIMFISTFILSLGGCAVNDKESNDNIIKDNEINDNSSDDNKDSEINDNNKKNDDNESNTNDNNAIENTTVNNSNNNSNSNSNNNNNSNSYEEANKWMDYVMSANINSIKLKYCVYDETGENEPEQEIIDITKEDLNGIFTEMKKGTISKSYYGGFGGPCTASINIDYSNADIQTELKLVYFKILDFNSTKDNKVISYLEKGNYMVKKYQDDIDLDNEPWSYEYTYNQDIIDIVIAKYSK